MERKVWKTARIVLLFFLVFIMMPVLSHAQEYPTKPINFIMPTTIGTVPRALLEDAKKFIEQPFVITVKAGGGGTVAMTALAKEKPDGYTVAMATPLPLVVIPQLRKMSYSLEDFTPITTFSQSVAALVVRADSPWNTLKDLVEYTRKNPRKVRCSVSSGVGNFKEVALRCIAKKEGIDWIYVPYPTDDGPGLTDLLGGHIEVLSAGPVWVPHVKAGKLRILAAYMHHRMKSFPDVPTLEELGYGLSLEVPLAVFGPKGTPQAIVKKLDSVFRKALDEPGFIQTVKNSNYELVYYNPEDSKKWFDSARVLWASLIKEYNIPAE